MHVADVSHNLRHSPQWNRGDSAKIAASGLIMAILGGALLTPLQALVSDVCGISYSFAVPLLCFAVVLALCRRHYYENCKSEK